MPEPSRHLDLPRGVHDADVERTALYTRFRGDWFEACMLTGYQPVEVPPVGFQETFTHGHHAAGDRTYQFSDRGGRNLALVSDSLPTVLRLAATQGSSAQRLSHCTPIFRYERRPRRYFHHLGLMEVQPGMPSSQEQHRSTARLVLTVASFLRDKVRPVFVLTDPGLWHDIADQVVPVDQTAALLNELRRTDPAMRPAVLHQRGADRSYVALAEQLAGNSALPLDDEAGAAAAECQALARSLRRHGIRTEINLGELHGVEFHDGPSFLIRMEDEPRLLGDGGSYGAFSRRFLGSQGTVHSAVLGLERLADLCQTHSSAPPCAELAVLIDPQSDIVEEADQLCFLLRRSGIAVWDQLITKPIRHHLRDLGQRRIPYSLIFGGRELAGGPLTLRDGAGKLVTMNRDAVAAWLKESSNRSLQEPM